MADVKITITGDPSSAIAAYEKTAKAGVAVSDRLSNAFETLGIKSASDMESAKTKINNAFDQIKTSGVATADEIRRAEDARAKAIEDIDRQNFTTRKGLLDQFKEHWISVTIAIAAAWVIVSKAWNLAESSAQFTEQKAALNSLAAQYNTTASEIIRSVQEASSGLISMADAASVSAKALMMGLNPQQITDFMKVVEATTNVTGQSVSAAFESIVEAAAAGRERSLKQMGIMVDLNAAYKDHAAKLGKTTDALSEVEKQQAAVNAILGKSGDILKQLGDQGDSTADKMERFKVMVADASLVLGDVLIRAVAGASAALFGFSAVFNGLIGGIALGIQKLFELGGMIPGIGKMFDPLASAARAVADQFLGAAKIASDNVVTSWDAMTSSGDKAAKGVTSMGDAVKNAAEDEKKHAEQIKKTVEELKGFSTAIKEAGKDALKFADEKFTTSLKAQEKSIDGMTAAMREYEGVIDGVYGSQVKALEKLKDAMKEAGADPKEIKAQGVAILEAEKAQATARLGAWTKYYEPLKGLQATAIEEMKKKQDELTQIKQAGKEDEAFFRKKYGLDTEQALDPFQKFYKDLEKLDAYSASAMKLSGDEKIKAVQGVIAKFKELPTEIKDGEDVLISSLDIYDKITIRVGDLQTAIEAEKQAEIDKLGEWKTALSTAMNEAQGKMTDYQNQIIDLSNKMSSLALQVNDSQAVSAISGIKSLLDSIPSVVTTTVQVKNAGSSAAASANTTSTTWDGQLSGYHMENRGLTPNEAFTPHGGSSYISKTGSYQLLQGEQVLNRTEVTNKQQSRSVSITTGDIVIQGSNKDSRQLAREIREELKRLEYVQ